MPARTFQCVSFAFYIVISPVATSKLTPGIGLLRRVATVSTGEQAQYFEALVRGINKMGQARALGMVDTNGDGIADAVGYDTKGDGCVAPCTLVSIRQRHRCPPLVLLH